MSGIIVDLIIAAVILFFLIFYTCKGFAKSILKVGTLILSIFLTSIFGKMVANICSKLFVHSFAEKLVNSQLPDNVADEALINLQETLDTLPDIFKKLFSLNSLRDKAIETFNDFKIEALKLVDSSISTVVGYIMTFAILFLVLSLVSLIISKLFEIPVLKQINKIFGFIFGLGIAYLSASFLVLILTLFVSSDVLQTTYLYNFIVKIGLFTK